MKITKRQLRRIIREEKARLAEGMPVVMDPLETEVLDLLGSLVQAGHSEEDAANRILEHIKSILGL